MRILFMGTPDFAVASLRRLVEDGHEICGVFTQPDKPKNRGHKLAFSPVKEYALSQGLTVYQPVKLRDGTALELIRSLAPELTVVAAYGRILPEDILAAPKLGSINVHSSLLPKYRGAAPINWAVLNGDAVTGVTIMYMAKELDAGDIISAAETPIDPDEDALTLTNRLAELGADPVPDGAGAERRHRRPHPTGRERRDLRSHAEPGAVPHGLHPPRPQSPRSGPWPPALALRRDGAVRRHGEGVPYRCGRRRQGRPRNDRPGR